MFEVLVFWRAAEYVKGAADAAYGSDEKASTKWLEAKRHILRQDPKGVEIVIDAPRYLLRKGRGKTEIRKALGYFRNNRRRMNYYHVAKEGYPIGSGEVEAANKMLVTHRLKRSGQRWGRSAEVPDRGAGPYNGCSTGHRRRLLPEYSASRAPGETSAFRFLPVSSPDNPQSCRVFCAPSPGIWLNPAILVSCCYP